MALDTGKLGLHPMTTDAHSADAPAPTLDYGPHIGSALRALREHKGFALQKLAELTRIRPAYLQALEDMRLDELPARPFALGYVRSYAQALGEDPDSAITRFKAYSPDPDDPLQAPVGVSDGRDPRLAMVVVAGLIILGVIAAWNITQRLLNREAPAVVENAAQPAPKAALAPGAPVEIGAPLPPPSEATMPAPYVTPGLPPASGATAAAGTPSVVAPAVPPAPQPAAPAVPARFTPRGPVFGVRNAPVIVQATRAGSVVLRRGDGSTAEAIWLSAGDAFGAQVEPGWTLEVSDPVAFQVYANGVSTGPMPGFSAPLSQLAPRAPRPAPPPATAAVSSQAQPSTPSPPSPASPAAAALPQ